MLRMKICITNNILFTLNDTLKNDVMNIVQRLPCDVVML